MITPQDNCQKCKKIKIDLEEKTKECEILKKNILVLKSQLFDTSNLISSYIQIKQENEKLKDENKELNEKIEEAGDNYQFTILKEKHLKLQEKYKELQIIYNQANLLLEQFQKNKLEGNSKTNENKLKRELSEKEKQINNQKLIISRLQDKTNLKIDENGNFESYELQNYYMNNNNEYKRENEIKINELYKEKEFLENEYQKYKEKYIIYKSKYKEFKNNITFFMKFLNFSNINYHPIEDFEKILGNKRERENKQINNMIENNKIRKISIDSNNIGSDIFDKKYLLGQNDLTLDFEEEKGKNNINNIQNQLNKNDNNQNNQKNKNNSNINEEKDRIKTRKMEKNKSNKEIIEEKKNNNFIDEKINDNNIEVKEDENEKKKELTPKKKKGRKPKNNKEEEEKKVNEKIDKKIENKIQKLKKEELTNEKKEELTKEKKEKLKNDKKDFQIIKNDEKQNIKEENKNISKEERHINPIKRPKIIQENPENLKETFLQYLITNSKNEITKEFIFEKFEKVSSISEKINLIFETIIPNIKKIDISNMLLLIEMFIECYIEKENNNIVKIIVNFIENINLELNNLQKNKNKFKVTKDYKNFKIDYLNKNSCAFSFINFSLLILSEHSNDLSEISKFLYKIALNNTNNNILNKICSFFKENNLIINNKTFINEKELILYKSENNINSFYFIQSFKTRIVSEKIFNLIINCYSNNKIEENEIQNLFLDSIKQTLNLIDENLIINQNNNIFNLSQNIIFLEIYQIFSLMVNLLKFNWIYFKIFEEIFWSDFTNKKKNSFKRICDIYYSSLLFNLILKKEGKDSIKGMNIQNKNEHIGQFYGWLSSIFNPDKEFFDLISPFERICSLSWIIESHIFNMLGNPLKTVKEVINDLIKNYPNEIFPKDFIDIVKKINK